MLKLIEDLTGLSTLKMALVGGAALAILAAGLTIRQHYINAGWDRALATVKAQDDTAKSAASKAQMTVDRCYDQGGAWSTITGNCTLEAKP